MARARKLAAAAALALALPVAQASEDQPLWEVGAGLSALTFPAYRGSNESRRFALPVPYFAYHGKFLKADRHGVRGQLFETEWLDLTVSAALSPPAASDAIAARQGMPDLKASFELGPRLDITLWHTENHARSLKLELPLRAAFTLDKSLQNIGWVAHPKLNLDVTDLAAMHNWNLGLQVGPLFGDGRQHAFYYSVAPQYATAARPAYEAKGGYAGMQYLTSLSKRFPAYWVGAFARYDNLSGARFADSPLVRTRNYVAAGLAVSWILGQSSARVPVDD